MARRMIEQSIIESDAFLSMSASAQMLYIHLMLAADDDGLLNCARRVQKIVGASPEDLNLLFEKRFLLPLGDDVVAIKHWLVHNHIRKDRHHATLYPEKMKMLIVKDNGAYTYADDDMTTRWQPLDNQMATKPQPDDNQMSTEISIGKVSLGKDKESITPPAKTKPERNIIPPTVEMVRAYCDQRRNGIDAQRFIDYYSTRGWMLGKAKMKDWQAAVRTWEGNQKVVKPKANAMTQMLTNPTTDDDLAELERRLIAN